MKKILFLILIIAPAFFITQKSYAYNCNYRSPECSADKYPTCDQDVSICEQSKGDCSMTENIKNKNGLPYTVYCAHPKTGAPNPTNPGNPSLITKPVNPTANNCPICPLGYSWNNTNNGYCIKNGDKNNNVAPIGFFDCSQTQACLPGCGCDSSCSQQYASSNTSSNTKPPCGNGQGCQTGLGFFPTDERLLISRIFGLILSVSGGVALILIIFSGYRVLSSQGNPEALKGAREQLTAAIIGLLFIIFAFVILQIIGYDILRIPAFGISIRR